jgi:hypothetical protein
MALPSKGMDLATLNAIHEWMKQGNSVKTFRPDDKLIKRDTWQGAKITTGFKIKSLSDDAGAKAWR